MNLDISLKRSLIVASTLFALGAAFFGLPPRARAMISAISPLAPIAGQHAAPIPRAVGLYLTERGQAYFRDHLIDVIARQGFELGDGGFDSWTYQAQDPIQLGNLPLPVVPFFGPLGSARDAIKSWLLNTDLEDPLARVQLQNIAYSAHPTVFGVHADRDATSRLSGGGVVLVFEAEFPKILLQIDSIRANDLNNDALFGVFGVDNAWAGLNDHPQPPSPPSLDRPAPGAPPSVPLRVSAPFSLTLDGNGGIRFELLGISTNLPDADLQMGFTRPMLLPVIKLRINGYPMTLSQPKLEQELIKLHAPLLKAAQAYLASYAVDNGPAAINSLVRTKFANRLFSDVNVMDPPGADKPPAPADRYTWGVMPEEIELTRDYLKLGLSGFIEDPKARNPFAEVSRRQVTQPPALDLVNPATFDAAIAINEDLVNRVIGMGYQRGYESMRSLDIAGSAPLKVLQPPEFHFNSSADRGKLHLRVLHKVEGITEEMAIRGEVTFEMDINARLVHNAAGNLSVVADSVDTGSLKIDYSTVHGLFRGIVHSKLMGHLTSTNQDLAKKPKVIVDALPVPNQIEGIPIKIRDFRADPHGYLVLYAEFDLSR
jgi:hypothetical protein